MKGIQPFASSMVLTVILSMQGFGQTLYFTGDTTDVQTQTSGGIVLSGGAGEVDPAMRWFLQRSGGGDIVVLRASGSDGYQSYLFSELGVTVNSVETILTTTAEQAQNPYVAQQIRKAEGLWIAGGDQARYLNYWKNTPIEDAIRYLIHEKKVPIGGISAGMAVMGDAYFAAMNGSVTSAEALANPYDTKVSIGYNDFLDSDLMEGVITDTHFDDPDRRGRAITFLARMQKDYELPKPRIIACEEYTAVCIDTNGIATVFGEYPSSQDFAYFVQLNCLADDLPESCVAGTPLHWEKTKNIVKAYKIPATKTGTNTFNMKNWLEQSGGAWQDWWVGAGGVFNVVNNALPPDCIVRTLEAAVATPATLYPNPAFSDVILRISETDLPAQMTLYDTTGRTVFQQDIREVSTRFSLQQIALGQYSVVIQSPSRVQTLTLVRME